MAKNRRKQIILLLVVALAGLFLAAISLSHLQFQVGRPFSSGSNQTTSSSQTPSASGSDLILLILRGFMALAAIVLLIHIFINLRTPEGRRRLLYEVILLALVLAIVFFVSEITQKTSPDQTQSQAANLAPPTGLQIPNSNPTDQFTPGKPSSWLVYGLSLRLAAILVGVIALVVRQFWRQRRASPPAKDRIAEAAQDAMNALASGGNLKDVIERCYLQMSQVLAEERNLRRETVMTPAEFEQFLVLNGVPEIPIQRLTRLFEAVRYGQMQPGNNEEQQALDSLSAIISACKG